MSALRGSAWVARSVRRTQILLALCYGLVAGVGRVLGHCATLYMKERRYRLFRNSRGWFTSLVPHGLLAAGSRYTRPTA